MSNQNNVSEFLKCSQDIVYFAETYLKIKLYDTQKELLQSYIDNRFNVTLASRQVGCSMIALIYLLHNSMFNTHKTNVMITHNMACAKVHKEKLMELHTRLPDWMQIKIRVNTKSRIQFETDSWILFSGSPHILKGMAISTLILDNFAWHKLENQRYVMLGAFPSLASGKQSHIMITSSLPRDPNWFNHVYSGAKNGENNFIPHNILWDSVTTRDENWLTEMVHMIGTSEFRHQHGNTYGI